MCSTSVKKSISDPIIDHPTVDRSTTVNQSTGVDPSPRSGHDPVDYGPRGGSSDSFDPPRSGGGDYFDPPGGGGGSYRDTF